MLGLPQVNPSDLENEALLVAAANGHRWIVQLLLDDKRVDPSCRDGRILVEACKLGRPDVVLLLLKDPRVG